MAQRSRFAHIAVREASFVTLSILGAILFLNHQILYMTGEKPSSLSWLAYVASTAVIYAFVRGIFFAGEMRIPRVGHDPNVCPECGQPLADGTPLASRTAQGQATHGAHARTGAATPIRLLRPIPPPSPSVLDSKDVLNPTIESIFHRLAENPPSRFARPAPPGSKTFAASTPRDESSGQLP